MVDGFQAARDASRSANSGRCRRIVRFVLIENLRRIAIRVDRSRDMRNKANDVADQIVRLGDAGKFSRVLAEDARAALRADNTFVTQFLYRLRDGSQTSGFVDHLAGRAAGKARQRRRGGSGGRAEPAVVRQCDDEQHHPQPARDRRQRLGRLVRRASARSTMRSGTRSDYSTLDFGSRNKYRNTIEKLARRSGKTELEVTQIAWPWSEAAQALRASCSRMSPMSANFSSASSAGCWKKAIGYRPTAVCRRFIRHGRKLDWLAIAGPNISADRILCDDRRSMFFVSPMDIRTGAKLIMLLLCSRCRRRKVRRACSTTLVTLCS